MRVISKKAITQFIDIYPQSAEPLLRWYLVCKENDWRNFAELRRSFGSTDSVGDGLFVFNLGGNKYRLIARINFGKCIVYIRFIGVHTKYDQVNLSDL